MNKRIAVCISGHLREHIDGYINFKTHVIDANPDCTFDFFIDTWKSREWRKSLDKKVSTDSKLHDVVHDILKLYDPVEFHIEDDRDWDTSEFQQYIKPGYVKRGTKGEHILGMYYKIMMCNSLKNMYSENREIDYDIVMRCRSDIGVTSNIVFTSDIIDECKFGGEKSSLFVAKNTTGKKEWLSDVLAFSSSQIMSYYSGLFSNIHKIVDKHKIFRPEPLLYYYISHQQKIEIKEIESDWYVIRS